MVSWPCWGDLPTETQSVVPQSLRCSKARLSARGLAPWLPAFAEGLTNAPLVPDSGGTASCVIRRAPHLRRGRYPIPATTGSPQPKMCMQGLHPLDVRMARLDGDSATHGPCGLRVHRAAAPGHPEFCLQRRKTTWALSTLTLPLPLHGSADREHKSQLSDCGKEQRRHRQHGPTGQHREP